VVGRATRLLVRNCSLNRPELLRLIKRGAWLLHGSFRRRGNNSFEFLLLLRVGTATLLDLLHLALHPFPLLFSFSLHLLYVSVVLLSAHPVDHSLSFFELRAVKFLDLVDYV